MRPQIPRINYKVRERDLKYYIFDWDDNILHMPTYIHLERRLANGKWVPHLVSTSLFAVIRNDSANYRPPGGDWERAFVEFRDFAGDDESKFLTDAREALELTLSGSSRPPSSFETFRRTLIEGRLFAIVTARGHRSETLRKGVRLFMERTLNAEEKERMLSNLRGYLACFQSEEDAANMSDREVLDNYLALNRYHAVTSPQFERMVRESRADAATAEARKQFAVSDFLEYLFGILESMPVSKPISVGFSDDDPANVRAVEEYIRAELAQRFPSVKFVVYDTSEPAIEKGRKIVVAGQLDLEF